MKKSLIILIAVIGLAALPLSSVSADNWNWHNQTQVSGIVTENGRDVRNAKVEVICNGHKQRTSTNRHGWYQVDFNSRQCKPGSTVTVTGAKGPNTGMNSGRVDHRDNDAWINVSIYNDVALPEFGLLTSTAALIGAVAVLIAVRKKSLSTRNN